MPTYWYEQVSRQGTKSGPCTVCGKNAKRSKTFSNTISPFNTNPDGTMRTYAEVATRVENLVTEWLKEPVTHAGCE